MANPASPRSAFFAGLVVQQPNNELFRLSLAQALVAEDRLPEAIDPLLFCVNSKADWMMPRILLGKGLLTLGRRDEAKLWLTEALKLATEQQHEDPERELRAILTELESK